MKKGFEAIEYQAMRKSWLVLFYEIDGLESSHSCQGWY